METDRNCQKKYLPTHVEEYVCRQGSHGLAAKTRSWNCFSTCVEQTYEIRVFIVLWTGYKLKKSLNLY